MNYKGYGIYFNGCPPFTKPFNREFLTRVSCSAQPTYFEQMYFQRHSTLPPQHIVLVEAAQ